MLVPRLLWHICALGLLAHPSVAAVALGTDPTGPNKHAVEINHLPTQANRWPRPFYAIAHRVLTVQGVKDALGHGANALEIDATAFASGWLADHDASPSSAGDTMESMFHAIVHERHGGSNITFVWLDIKNADWCDPADPNVRHCSIAALRDLARRILEPANVRVLYGFRHAGGTTYNLIRDGLDANEAISLNGEAKTVKDLFDANGPSDPRKRVMSYGYNDLPFDFGNCYEPKHYTCTELRRASQSRVFGQVYGRTLLSNQRRFASRLLGDADVDGIVYGLAWTNYTDDPGTRAAFQAVMNWLREHPQQRYLATVRDAPW